MNKYDCFTQLDNPKVKLDGIQSLKNYLLDKIPLHNNLPVVRFVTVGQDIFVTVVDSRTSTHKYFFGYIEDIALDIQRGLYEEQADE